MVDENFLRHSEAIFEKLQRSFHKLFKKLQTFPSKGLLYSCLFHPKPIEKCYAKRIKNCSAVFDDTFVQYQNETRSDSYMLSLLLFLYKRFRSCPQLRMNGQTLETLKVFDSFSIVLEELCSTLAPE